MALDKALDVFKKDETRKMVTGRAISGFCFVLFFPPGSAGPLVNVRELKATSHQSIAYELFLECSGH